MECTEPKKGRVVENWGPGNKKGKNNVEKHRAPGAKQGHTVSDTVKPPPRPGTPRQDKRS